MKIRNTILFAILLFALSCNAQWRDFNIRLRKEQPKSVQHVLLSDNDSTSQFYGQGIWTPLDEVVESSQTNNYDTIEQVWHGQKYLGNKTIYWKSFLVESGNNEFIVLNGLSQTYDILQVDASSYNIINGAWAAFTIELDNDYDHEDWSMFLTISVADAKITVWYTKPD